MIETYYPSKSVNFFAIGLLAPVLAIPGLVLISGDNDHYGILMLGLWLSLFTMRNGVKIDYREKQIQFFKEYVWLRVYYFPNSLNSYTSYRFKRVSETYSYGSRVQSSQVTQEFHSIELLNNTSKKYERIALGDLNEIKRIATLLEKDLGLIRIVKSNRAGVK